METLKELIREKLAFPPPEGHSTQAHLGQLLVELYDMAEDGWEITVWLGNNLIHDSSSWKTLEIAERAAPGVVIEALAVLLGLEVNDD